MNRAIRVLTATVVGILASMPSNATAAIWQPSTATAYGPGLYGNRTACGQTLTTRTIGVAHRTLPCGTRLTIAANGRRVRVRVIDRGPYASGVAYDLTHRTVRLLGYRSVYEFGRRTIWTRRGW